MNVICCWSEYREAENLLYILMECGELDFDKYLKDTIKQEGHLSPLYIKFYWQSMLQAVGALHKEGQAYVKLSVDLPQGYFSKNYMDVVDCNFFSPLGRGSKTTGVFEWG